MIICDTREKNVKQFLERNEERLGGYEIKQLPSADYTNEEKSFAIERKTANDFYNSIKNEHVYEEVARMQEDYPGAKLYILFEGDFDQLVNDYRYKHMRAKMLAFRYNCNHYYGCEFIQSWYTQQTFDIIKEIDYFSKMDITIKRTLLKPTQLSRRKIGNTYMPVDKRLASLLPIPHVGRKSAELLLGKFKSLRKIANATKEEIITIKGIGVKTAESTIDWFRRTNKCGKYGKRSRKKQRGS